MNMRLKITFILLLVTCGTLSTLCAQDNEYFEEYNRSKRLLAFKVGAGTGAKYGGFGGGANTEFDVGYFGLSFGCGFIYPNTFLTMNNSETKKSRSSEVNFGWQTGIKIYAGSPLFNVRPSINLLFGNVYAYYINYYDSIMRGKYFAFTPSVIIDHDIGKKRGLSLSYGIGIFFHKPGPPEHEEILARKQGMLRLLLSPMLGVNYNLY
jgi:hypothetical protein